MIRQEGDKWVLYSKDGSKKLGEFDSKKEAEDREAEIERIKHSKENESMDVVEWLASRAPSEVQSVILSKEKYDAETARVWCKEHGFKTGDVEETEDAFVYPQIEMSEFVAGSTRTIEIKDGIQAVVGRKKGAAFAQLVLYRGEGFSRHGGGKFAKDIVARGEWFHPVSKKKVYFDDARINRLIKQTSRYIANGNRIPFPDGHSFKAADNLGYWTGPFIDRGDRMFGVVEPRGKDVADKLATGKIDQVSAWIDFDWVDTKGNYYPEVITHVCATSYPVLTGQRDFVKLSAVESDGGPISGFLPIVPVEGTDGKGATTMKFAKIAKSLGLDIEGKDEAEVLSMIESATEAKFKVIDDGKKANEALSAIGAELKSRGLRLDGVKVVEETKVDSTIKDEDDAEKRALKEHLARVDLELAKAKVDKAVAFARKAVAEGRIPPSVAEKVEKLCLIGDRAEFVALSADKSEVVKTREDAFSLFRDIVAELPAFGRGLSTVTKGQKKSENDEAREYGVAVSRRLQGNSEKK
jgi:hypothetical protein